MLNNIDKGMYLRFCTGVSKLDFYPFAEIKNWKNLGYWLLVLKPYIDKENSADGILENYTFSEAENSLEATVSLKATWQDGTPVSSFEAAMGIAKGFTHREHSTSIRVIGTEDINNIGWEKKSYKGIEIISPIKFKLFFEGKIDNIKGVLEDALSFKTLRNIIWPVRLNSFTNPEYNSGYFDIVSKYPIRFENGKYFLNVLGNQVELSTLNSKNGYDFYFNTSDYNQFKNQNEADLDFIVNKKQNMHTFIGIYNSNSKLFSTKKSRLQLSSILRNIACSLSKDENYHVPKGHFDTSEPGYQANVNWPIQLDFFPEDIKDIKIAIPYLTAKNKVLQKFEELSNKNGISIEWIDMSEDYNKSLDADLQIFIARIQNNRQIWLQNILNSNSVIFNLEKFPKTIQTLKAINIKSASTIPIKQDLLENFENSAFEEVSIIPIFRYYLHSYSRKNLPIVLNISENKEFYFSLNKN